MRNEASTIGEILLRLQRTCGEFAEIIVVDDGSIDGSHDVAKRLARPQDTVLAKRGEGKGSAVRMGYAKASGRYVIVQDADLEYSPEEIPALLGHAETHALSALFGSRNLGEHRHYTHIAYYVGGLLLTKLCNLLYGCALTDQPTCYKLIRSDMLRELPLRENDFRFDAEVTCYLLLNGCRVEEQPISYRPRSSAEGKKIKTRDWFLSVWVIVFLRFFGRRMLREARGRR